MTITTQISLLKKRRTKIVATLGPASNSQKIIEQLIKAGVNVFRLNMSHGDHKSHQIVYRHIRKISEKLNEPVAILADLCGPKIRTGKFQGGEINLQTGKRVIVTTRDVIGKSNLIPSQYKALADDVKKGNMILLNDGAIELKVNSVKKTEINCSIIYGGTLKDYKGINLPGVQVSAPSLTDKDKEDARFALKLGVDFLALSFVRRASDINELRQFIKKLKADASIIAKIEKPEALEYIDEILDASNGIMVARGDLGVELKPEEVPVAQNQLIEKARYKFKPVIVATQMLESMIDNARPTRAEVADITHAVSQRTDAVMLSAETATGIYPVEAVKMMDRIVRQTEAHLWKSDAYSVGLLHSQAHAAVPIWDAIANTVNTLAHQLKVRAIIVLSRSGMSATTLVAARPSAPVVAITHSADVCRKMALMWSIIPVLSDETAYDNPNTLAKRIAADLDLGNKEEQILIVRGFHEDPDMNMPSITVLTM